MSEWIISTVNGKYLKLHPTWPILHHPEYVSDPMEASGFDTAKTAQGVVDSLRLRDLLKLLTKVVKREQG
jgi:hypothetical protein